MDWNLIERLAPALAWPIVALIALPFAIWRINSLIRALDQAQNLSSGLRGLLDLDSQMSDLSSNIKRLREEVELIRTAQIADTKERVAEEAGPDVEASINIKEFRSRARETIEEVNDLYDALSNEWRYVLESLNAAYARYRMGLPDRRSVGSAAVYLTDKRRRAPLANDDAETLAELHGLYKRYARLKHELDEEALNSFTARARDMVGKLNAVGV